MTQCEGSRSIEDEQKDQSGTSTKGREIVRSISIWENMWKKCRQYYFLIKKL